MRSPAAAFAWELSRHHRWGLGTLGAALVALAVIRLIVMEQGARVHFEDGVGFAFVVIIPMTGAFFYFLAVFSFGLSGDLAARQSMFPTRMLVLPVSSSALAGWPMLYGALAMTFLWLAARLLALWPSDFDVPLVWPALLAAAILAWTQALTWLAYPLRGLRVAVSVIILISIDVVVITAFERKVSEWVMLAILAPLVPLAYFAARFAVGRARRGEIPDWHGVFVRITRVTEAFTRERAPFPSAARAQLWFEWRQYGWSLPVWVAILLPFELGLLFVFPDTPSIVFWILVVVLFTPAFMAIFVAARSGRLSRGDGDAPGVAPFLATRPLSDAGLVGAKLKAALRSTLAAWALVLAAIPLALHASGTMPMVLDWYAEMAAVVGARRVEAFVLAALVLLMLLTWKQLVQALSVAMSGREGLVRASIFVPLFLLTIAFPLGGWILETRELKLALFQAIPWIAVVLVLLKISVSAWIAVRLHERRLLDDRTLLVGAICWNLAVLALFALLAWIFPFFAYLMALFAVLAIPLVRLSAAPLALAWNRHR